MNEPNIQVLSLIAAADDFRVTLMFETFLHLVTESGHQADEVIRGFPPEVLGVSQAEILTWIDDDFVSEVPASRAFSTEFCRSVLALAAVQPAIQSFATRAVTHPDDDKLKAGVTVKIGAMATALMLVASTGFEIDLGGVKIHKEPLTAETIIALSGLVASLRGELPPPLDKKIKPKANAQRR